MKWNRSKALCWLALCWSFLFFSAEAYSAEGDLVETPYSGEYDAFSSGTGLCVQAHSAYTPAMDECYSSSGAGWAYSGVLGCPVKACDGACDGGQASDYMTKWNAKEPWPSGCVAPIAPPPKCPAAGSVTYPTVLDGGLFIATQPTVPSTGPNGTSFCLPYNGDLCEVKCSTGMAGPNPIASGYAVACTSLTATGAACSGQSPMELTLSNPLEVQPEGGPGTEPSAPGDCPPGTGFAQVNNKSMCLPSGTTATGGSSSSTSGDVTTASSSELTVNGDGTTSMTTKSTVTSPEGTISSTSVNTSGVNGADGADSKGVDLGPAPVFADPGNGGTYGDMPVGELSELDWHQVFLAENGSCALADIPLTVMGVSIDIPMSSLCPYLGIVKGLMIFISVLVSIRLFAMAPW